MRFHPKFPLPQALSGVCWVALAILYIFKRPASSPIVSAYVVLGVLYFLSSGWAILKYFRTYWDLDSEILHEQRYWTIRSVPYAEITAVGPWNSNRPSSAYINIEYGKLGSAFESRSNIIANPSDRDVFLNILRKYAKQADFTV